MFCLDPLSFVKTLHKMFGLCTCKEHASFSEINYTETAFYPQCLAKALLKSSGTGNARPLAVKILSDVKGLVVVGTLRVMTA